jgi:predicted RNA-binding protein with RPS1 domain/uncharacterized LabA/DUF88 family protein
VEPRREVALFIDLENVREGIRQAYGIELAPSLLIEKARKYGLVNVARAYADCDGIPPEMLREMRVSGIHAVDSKSHVVGDGRRSAAALDLLMDLIETLLDRSGIPTVLLLSGDRDFVRVVTMARNRFGKEVIISGVPGTVSADLIDAAGGNFDPLEVPGVERAPERALERTPSAGEGEAAPEPSPQPERRGNGYARPSAPPARYERAPRAAPAAPPATPPEASPRVERTPERTVERTFEAPREPRAAPADRGRPQFGRRATRVTRGPQEPARPRLPQPDVEEELAQQDGLGEAPVPAWQRGKLAERAEAIEKRLAERRAAGESLPPSALGAPAWQPGDLVEGTVKSITDFGAFLDLGGIDALLHVSQMAWQHVRHPSQVVQIGEKLSVRVLEVDESSGRVSVGLKQLSADPWLSAADKYEVGRLVRGRVSGVKEYGVFVELEPGIFGLLHVSNIFAQPWGHHPGERYKLDQDVEVVVSKIDPDMRRLAFVLQGTPIEATAASSGAMPVETPAGVSAEPGDDEEAAEAAFRFREGDDEN